MQVKLNIAVKKVISCKWLKLPIRCSMCYPGGQNTLDFKDNLYNICVSAKKEYVNDHTALQCILNWLRCFR